LGVLECINGARVRSGGLNALAYHDHREKDELEERLSDSRHHQNETW
jgi:hypothetical protein